MVGIRQNTHLRLIGGVLASHAIPVNLCHEVPDDFDLMKDQLAAAWERSDLVIATGGLGPTTDDLTREVAADVLGRELIHDESIESELREFFRRRGSEPTENNFRQCAVISGAEILNNPNGTAPGQWIEVEGKVMILLPGPPRELEPMFRDVVLTRLIEKGWAIPHNAYLQLRTSGIGESRLASDLEPIFRPYEDRLRVAYCAHEGKVDLRLAALDGRLSDDEINAIGDRCRRQLGFHCYGTGEIELAEAILSILGERGRRLVVAEGATGGMLAAEFSGASAGNSPYVGGFSIQNDVSLEQVLDVPPCLLRQHGIVSPETVVAMATGAAEKFEVDYALSVVVSLGYPGDTEPAGTIHLGLSSPMGVWSRQITASGIPASIRHRAVTGALDFLHRKLLKYEVHDFLDRMCSGCHGI